MYLHIEPRLNTSVYKQNRVTEFGTDVLVNIFALFPPST
jgi:hypothetical protein